MVRIAIQPDNTLLTSGRRQSFSRAWAEKLTSAGQDVRMVDAYERGFFEGVKSCEGFMWSFPHLPLPRNFAKRLLPALEHGVGIPVFPSWRTIWHYDDKVATYGRSRLFTAWDNICASPFMAPRGNRQATKSLSQAAASAGL